jgi:chorismate mutase
MTFLSFRSSGCAAAAASLLALPVAATHATEVDPAFTDVVSLVSQRLTIAEPIAHWKWDHHEAILDKARQQQGLANITAKAQRAGVDQDFARAFFQDQLNESTDIQYALFARWQQVPPTGASVDPKTVSRPERDRLTQSLIAALVRVQPLRTASDCPLRLNQAFSSWQQMSTYDASRAVAMNIALSHVCVSNGSVAAN